MKKMLFLLASLSLSVSHYAQTSCVGRPSNITVIPQSPVNVAIIWAKDPGDAGDYAISFRPIGTTTWVKSQAGSNQGFVLLTLLKDNQEYEYILEKLCFPAGTPPLFKGTFKTGSKFGAAPCTSPSIPTMGTFCDPKSTGAQIYWQYVNGIPLGTIGNNQNSYKFAFRPMGSTAAFTEFNSAFPNKTLTNLLPSTTYEFKIKAMCSDGVSFSDYTQSFFFTTLK